VAVSGCVAYQQMKIALLDRKGATNRMPRREDQGGLHPGRLCSKAMEDHNGDLDSGGLVQYRGLGRQDGQLFLVDRKKEGPDYRSDIISIPAPSRSRSFG
jgi:hypothetical protein